MNKPTSTDKQVNTDDISLHPESIREILGVLPHRYPFVLVDRVTEHIQNKVIRGYKNVTINEPFFQGHFPGDPIMPGVLQLEALAQLGILLLNKTEKAQGKLAVFAAMDGVRFRRMVLPGDRFDMECSLLKLRPPIGKMACKGYVNGELAVEAEITCSMVDRSN